MLAFFFVITKSLNDFNINTKKMVFGCLSRVYVFPVSWDSLSTVIPEIRGGSVLIYFNILSKTVFS